MRISAKDARNIPELAKLARTVRARGRRRQPGGMNGWEREYADILEARKLAGEIAEYRFGALKLRLADRTFYDTDFFVMLADGSFEIHEVKGWLEDDAAVKLKVAAEMFPFRFVVVSKQKKHLGGGWTTREV